MAIPIKNSFLASPIISRQLRRERLAKAKRSASTCGSAAAAVDVTGAGTGAAAGTCSKLREERLSQKLRRWNRTVPTRTVDVRKLRNFGDVSLMAGVAGDGRFGDGVCTKR